MRSQAAVHDWQVQFYAMTGAATQKWVVRLLGEVASLAVEPVVHGRQHLVIVDCRRSQAEPVGKIVASVDPDAALVHTTHARPTTPTVTSAA